MPETFDCSVPTSLLAGVRAARQTLQTGGLVIMPTDTVYGIAADAFSPEAVAGLLAAKGRDRQSPPPVLVPDVATLTALAERVSDDVRALADAFWPGPLTIIVRAQPSLSWDLGETKGTVALRMPANDVALGLLAETGPLAVSSANRHGEPASTSAAAPAEALAESVAVVLDAGEVGEGYEPHADGERAQNGSTIVDATGERIRIVRQGVLSRERIAEVVGEALAP
ncbi:L-threonylcarbamoyladenylate synthase [Agrococcus jejuensis]|uniref:L-threonylcarbamoyladenylate synthase n=1 Tax=Agrococcus jejuensis TaxID=399736 RepID=A0A1G8AUW7_9MICO|nr:L-threonylcarbamoyladenylate synthase [Agrococcus jejuensis]SDH24761.1 tRNA threonylcarbamoyl adenosine modification protein, Sua5/YciO/YrdC/YwlC family [Agrococcus jejuensis]